MKLTLYSKLAEQFREMGFVVEQNDWTESVGYKKPTQEYWLDVIQDKGSKRVRVHYWFGSNLNKIEGFQIFTSELVIEEQNIQRFL